MTYEAFSHLNVYFIVPPSLLPTLIRLSFLFPFFFLIFSLTSFIPSPYAQVCTELVCHTSELPLVFHKLTFPQLNITLTPEEAQLSDAMGAYWSNFAKVSV